MSETINKIYCLNIRDWKRPRAKTALFEKFIFKRKGKVFVLELLSPKIQ